VSDEPTGTAGRSGGVDGLSDLRTDIARLEALHRASTAAAETNATTAKADVETVAGAVDAVIKRLDHHERATSRERDAERARIDDRFEKLILANDAKFSKHSEDLKHGLAAIARDGREQAAKLYEQLERDRKTPWAPVAVATTLILAIAGAFGSQYRSDLTRIEAQQTRVIEDLNEFSVSQAKSQTMMDDMKWVRERMLQAAIDNARLSEHQRIMEKLNGDAETQR
jgi:hypothetical protein